MSLVDRREALRRVAAILGGVVSAPTVAAVLASCDRAPTPLTVTPVWAPRTLTPARNETVIALSEVIIPETETPGARAARVNEFVDAMLTDFYRADERRRFLAGLSHVDARARRAHGRPFARLTSEQQTSIVAELDRRAFAPGADARHDAGDTGFYRMLKELTLIGYYTSEVGATKELRVSPFGPFRADIPYAEIGSAWA